MCCLLWVVSTTLFRECAPTQHRLDAPRACLLPAGRMLDRPCTRWAPGKIARPERKARSIRRASSEPPCAGSDPRTFRTYGFPPVPLFLGRVDRTDPRENLTIVSLRLFWNPSLT